MILLMKNIINCNNVNMWIYWTDDLPTIHHRNIAEYHTSSIIDKSVIRISVLIIWLYELAAYNQFFAIFGHIT